MQPNFELLDMTLAHIKTLPVLTETAFNEMDEDLTNLEGGNWYQEDWILEGECGTAACFAGHAYLLAGHVFDRKEERPVDKLVKTSQKELGLTDRQFSRITYENNSLEDIEEIICKWKEFYGDNTGS